jgi:hypothetical protein
MALLFPYAISALARVAKEVEMVAFEDDLAYRSIGRLPMAFGIASNRH